MKHFFILCILFLLPVRVLADISVQADADKTAVALNESFKITVTVKGSIKNISSPVFPSMKSFRVAASGRSQQVSIVNGKVEASYVYEYIFYPRQPGTFSIPPFEIKYQNKIYKTDPIAVEVVKQSSLLPQQKELSEGEDIPELFIEQEVENDEVYLGEQVIYTFKFYRRVNLLRNPSFEPPGFEGFIAEELPPNRNYRETVDGKKFLVTELKFALFPLKSGVVVVEPAKLLVTVKDISSASDIFDSFFSSGKQKTLKTEGLNVQVQPLPQQGRPRNFSGAVGDYKLEVNLDKYKCRQGEALTLIARIEGEGDPRPVSMPSLTGLTNFKVYETVSSLNLNKKNYRLTGSKEFRTLIIPQISGELRVPPVKFNYFNPDSGKYITKKSRSLNLTVTPAEIKDSQEDESGETEELRIVREDIRFITDSLGKKAGGYIYRSKNFRLAAGIPIYLWIISILFSLIRKKIIMPHSMTSKIKRNIRSDIKDAKKYLKEGKREEVYKEIEKISERLDCIPPEAEDIVVRARKNIYSPSKKAEGEDTEKDLKKFIKIIMRAIKIALPLLFLISGPLYANRENSIPKQLEIFTEANNYYRGGEFKNALNEYKKILKNHPGSEGIYYNMGNVYWRMGDPGRARLYWEKSLEISPKSPDTRYNINLLKESVGELSESGSFVDITEKLISLNGLTLLTTAFGWVFLLGILIFFRFHREIFFWISSAGFILFLIFAVFLFMRINYEVEITEAVVVRRTEIYSTPEYHSSTQGNLPAGHKIRIIRESGNWVEAGVEERGIKFWVPSENIEKI